MRLAVLLVVAVLVLDQATKAWIVYDVMSPPRIIPVTGFFNLVMVWNRGASFGILNTGAAWVPWFLAAVTVAVTIGLVVWLRRTDRWGLAAGIGLIIGGALGNLIDRVWYGAVADFVQLYYGNFYWPAFNVADSAITVGVILVLIDGFFVAPAADARKGEAG
ncbi:MAG: signal peptidase II [Alphaproteobacteria bacterium]|nr:signal peptidase II [Alphaproteobacteria bacterium]